MLLEFLGIQQLNLHRHGFVVVIQDDKFEKQESFHHCPQALLHLALWAHCCIEICEGEWIAGFNLQEIFEEGKARGDRWRHPIWRTYHQYLAGHDQWVGEDIPSSQPFGALLAHFAKVRTVQIMVLGASPDQTFDLQ